MENKKTEVLIVRLTPNIKRVVIERAHELGQKTGEYIRHLILKDTEKRMKISHMRGDPQG